MSNATSSSASGGGGGSSLEPAGATQLQALGSGSGGDSLEPTYSIRLGEEEGMNLNNKGREGGGAEIVNVTYQQGIAYRDDDTEVAAVSAQFEVVRNGITEIVYGEAEVVSRATSRKLEGGVVEFVGDVVRTVVVREI